MPAFGKITVWRDGLPYIEYVEPVTPQKFSEVIAQAYNRPYEIDPVMRPGDERFEGWTNLEVAATRNAEAAAHGDLDAFKYGADRTIGKPKQQIEQTIATLNLSDFAKQIIEIERVDPTPITMTSKGPVGVDVDAVVVKVIEQTPVPAHRLLEGI